MKLEVVGNPRLVEGANRLLPETAGNVDELKFIGTVNEGCLVPDDTALLKIVLGREDASANGKLCHGWDERGFADPTVWYGALGR